MRDIGLRGFSDDHIAAYAKANGLCLVTADREFFAQSDLINELSGKLAIVAFGRIRLREM